MKTIILIAFISFLLFLSSCTKKENNTNFRTISKEICMYEYFDDTYWYRYLEEGDSLILLDTTKKGKDDIIWHLVQNSGQKGWITDTSAFINKDKYVAGAEFIEVFRNFLKDSYEQNDLNKYLNPEIGIYYAFDDNDSGYKISKSAVISNNTPYTKNIPNIYDQYVPYYIRCYSWRELKPGFYCGRIYLDQILKYNERIKNDKDIIRLPDLPDYGAIVKTTLIINNQFENFMYFAQIDGGWYLIMIDLCTCSSGIDL